MPEPEAPPPPAQTYGGSGNHTVAAIAVVLVFRKVVSQGMRKSAARSAARPDRTYPLNMRYCAASCC